MKRFQIRDARFGLALRDGDSALDALTDFLHVRERADVRNAIKVVSVETDGTIVVTYKGMRLYVVPASNEH